MSTNNSSGSKLRVYELARELGIEDSKSLINILRGMGLAVKTASSSIPDEAAQKVRELIAPHLEQLRKEARAKKAKEDTKAPEQTPAAPPKRTIRIAKRATDEEKAALIERQKRRAEEQAQPVKPQVRIAPRPAAPKTIELKPVQPKVSDPKPAPVTPPQVAQPASTAPVAKPAVAANKPVPPVAETPADKNAAAKAAELKRRKPLGRPEDSDDEENEKDPAVLPQISAEEMGIKDEEVPLSLTPISPKEAFAHSAPAQPASVFPRHPNQGAAPQNTNKPGGLNKSRPGQQNAGRPGQAGGRPGQQGGRPGFQNRPGQGGGRPGQQGGRPGFQNRPGQGGRPGQRPGPNNSIAARGKSHRPQHTAPAAPVIKKISIPEVIALSELASRLSRPANELIKYLISQGKMVTINQAMTYDEACEIAKAFGFEVGEMADENIPLELIEDEDDGHLKSRPPVVTVLGHVDHGKTSLLDAIRRTSVTSGEAGGITQKIGAYTVNHHGRHITFIDTPGHEAFTHMRARGASITDVAILVVAANDGVMPQTIEAINHAKAANLPIIVAINKIDLPEANPEKVMQQLTEYDLLSEAWGGDTIMAEVSAKKHIGLEELLEMVLLVADMKELKANPDRRAQGTIIEGYLNKGMGPVATVLVQNGTLHSGDTVVVGKTWGRIRGLLNENGDRIRSAGPSMPAEIIGLSDVPNAGDHLQAVEDEKMAKQVSEARMAKERHTRITSGTKQTLESLFDELKKGVAKDLNLLVKADSHGSMQALNQSLNKLTTSEVAVKIIHSGVGAISESDVMLASASNAIIVGFNVRPDGTVKRVADQEEVEIRTYRVIYHVIEDIKKSMSGLLTPDIEEVNLGRVEVRQIFKTSKAGKVCGCYVSEGKVTRDGLVRLLRDSVVIYEGSVDTLKRFKDDAREVQEGYECGLTLTNYQDVQEGDVIEVYHKVEHQREL